MPADLEQSRASAAPHLDTVLNERAVGVDETSLLLVRVEVVSPGSPAYEAAAAAMCVDVAVRPLRFHLEPSTAFHGLPRASH